MASTETTAPAVAITLEKLKDATSTKEPTTTAAVATTSAPPSAAPETPQKGGESVLVEKNGKFVLVGSGDLHALDSTPTPTTPTTTTTATTAPTAGEDDDKKVLVERNGRFVLVSESELEATVGFSISSPKDDLNAASPTTTSATTETTAAATTTETTAAATTTTSSSSSTTTVPPSSSKLAASKPPRRNSSSARPATAAAATTTTTKTTPPSLGPLRAGSARMPSASAKGKGGRGGGANNASTARPVSAPRSGLHAFGSDEARKAYEAWLARKEEEARKSRTENKDTAAEEKDRLRRNTECFDSWVQRKKEQFQETKEREKLAQTLQAPQPRDAPDEKAEFDAWLQRKEHERAQRAREDQIRKEIMSEMDMQNGDRAERNKEAMESWLARKQAEEHRQREIFADKAKRWAAEARRIKQSLTLVSAQGSSSSITSTRKDWDSSTLSVSVKPL